LLNAGTMQRSKAICAIFVLSHALAAASAFAMQRSSLSAAAKREVSAAIHNTSGLNRAERRQLRQALNRGLRELPSGRGIELEFQRGSDGALTGVLVRGGEPVKISVSGNPKAELTDTRDEIAATTRRLYGTELEPEPDGFSMARYYAKVLEMNWHERETEIATANADPQRVKEIDGQYGPLFESLTSQIADHTAPDRGASRRREVSATVARLAKLSSGRQAKRLLAALQTIEAARSWAYDPVPWRVAAIESALRQGELPSRQR
jgi:hypothetical protein